MPDENKRETGARALKEDHTYRRPSPIDTGDRGDEPENPYGLTRPVNETEEKIRTSDGKSAEHRKASKPGTKQTSKS